MYGSGLSLRYNLHPPFYKVSDMTSTPSEQQLDGSGSNLTSSMWNFTTKPPTSTAFAVLWHAYLGC